MSILQLYNDENCTDLYKSVKVIELNNSKIGWFNGEPTMPGTMTLGDKTYTYYDGALSYGCAIQGFGTLNGMPFLSSNMTPFNPKTVYCKNGFSMEIGILSNGTVIFRHFRYGSQDLNVIQSYDSSPGGGQEPYFYAIGFKGTDDKRYIGFTRVWVSGATPPDSLGPICGFERSFWDSAFQPPYDYGTKPDDEGGEGTGNIPDGTVSKGTQTGTIPTGGRGLHWYRVTHTGYNNVQNYLWGDVSGTSTVDAIAKSLWQKFQNKVHDPSSCVVAAYKLPEIFMPARDFASGVQLAGVNLPTSGTYVTYPDFTYTEIDLGTVEPPFKSWVDYAGVVAKIGVPFCGEIAAPIEALYNRALSIRYCCDQHNGNIVATVWAGGHVIGETSGNVAYSIPISGGDDGTLDRIGAITKGVVTAVAAVASGGATAGAIAAGGIGSGIAGAAGTQYQTYTTNSNLSGSVSACVNGVSYVEYIYPRTAYPSDGAYAAGYGYVATSASGQIDGFKGGWGCFTVLKKDGGIFIPRATDAEKEEIIRILESGVII